MKFKGVIFDLDGTLLDTLEDLADSMNIVLEQYGFPIHDASAYRYFVGNGMKNLVKRSLPENCRSEENITHYTALMLEEYEKRWNHKTRPYEGINNVIDILRNKGVKLSVLSNKTHEFTLKVITEYFGLDKFEAVLGARENKPLKPDPAAALEISSYMGIEPEQIIYLGDSGVDMQTAVNAGMFAVGAAWGFRTEKELQENGAKAVIHSPEELLNFFDE